MCICKYIVLDTADLEDDDNLFNTQIKLKSNENFDIRNFRSRIKRILAFRTKLYFESIRSSFKGLEIFPHLTS